MPIICLEGASAVGKTTAAMFLENELGYVRVPEVNEMFERPRKESRNWYMEKQIERWGIARGLSKNGGIAVLDGDPLQPIWYNWVYNDLGFQPIDEVIDFYRGAFDQDKMSFPDQYFLLFAPHEVLKERKLNDTVRKRNNFEIHSKFVHPQLDYFRHMNKIQPNMSSFIEASSTPDVIEHIRRHINVCTTNFNHSNILKHQCDYVQKNV